MFISSVYADEAIMESGFSGIIASLVPLLIFVSIFYFLIMRPQQKKQKKHEMEISNLKPNDKIITMGGIYGIVKKTKKDRLIVEISNNIEIEVMLESVNLVNEET
jgi:preprotein translocase subunit YajC